MTERRAEGSCARRLAGWLVGFGSSVLADQVFFLSLTWAALQVGSPGQVGAVLAVGSVPRLLFLVVGGVVADRMSPKRIIIGTDTGRAVVMASAAAVMLLGSMNTWALMAVAVAIGALDGLFLPAVGALPVWIAPERLLGRVAALRTLAQRAAMLLGGPLAGWLIYLYGPSAAFWGSAVLFAVSVAALAWIPLAVRGGLSAPTAAILGGDEIAPSTGPAASQVLTGGRRRTISANAARAHATLRRDPVLWWLLLLVAGMNLGFAGPVTVGLPMLADAQRWGPRGAGLLLGGFGLGAAATGLSLVFDRRIVHAGLVALVGVATMGVALAAIGVTGRFATTLAVTVVLGLASGVFGTVVHAIVLTRTPKAELGRVMALLSLSVEGVVPISYAATGFLAGPLGGQATFFLGGGVILATTALAFSRHGLRSCQLTASENELPGAPPLDHPAAQPRVGEAARAAVRQRP